jgi:trigger factor
MQVTETLSEGLRRAFTVVLPAADIESRRAERLTRLSKTLRLSGFRPGKVPVQVVRQRYGAAVSAEVLQESISEATRQVLADRGLRPALQPVVNVVSDGTTSVGTGSHLEFSLEFELLPEITLPDFGTIDVTMMKTEISQDAVQKALNEIAAANRNLVDLTDGERATRGDKPGAIAGDTLTVDFVGKIGDTEFPGGAGTDIDVDIGGSGFVSGFAEQLEGMAPNDTRTIEVTLPADYGSADLAGKRASFYVRAKRLRRSVVPAIDGALAAKLGYESLDAMKNAVMQRIRREYDSLSRMRAKRQLLDALSAAVCFAVPEGMVEQEFEQIWRGLEADRQAGRMDEDDKGKDEGTLRTEYRAIAERRVRLGLLMAEIGRINNLTVSEDELNRAMRREAANHPGRETQMMELFRNYPAAVESLRGHIFEDKVVDFILALAHVIEQAVTPEELVKESPAEIGTGV